MIRKILILLFVAIFAASTPSVLLAGDKDDHKKMDMDDHNNKMDKDDDDFDDLEDLFDLGDVFDLEDLLD
ncbi:MAG: hypothetical protein AB1346_11740 [Thermodesulfobacteriota bacterium]